MQCGKCPQASISRSERIADRDSNTRRGSVRVTDDVAPATHCLTDPAKTGTCRVGPTLPVPRNAHNNKPRIRAPEFHRIEAPALERTWSKILDQDVGLVDQSTRQFLTVGLSQVDRHGPFVAGDDFPPQREFAAPPNAHRIALAGRFDLDDIRAHVAEQLTAKRPGNQLSPSRQLSGHSEGPLLFECISGPLLDSSSFGCVRRRKRFTWPDVRPDPHASAPASALCRNCFWEADRADDRFSGA